MTEGWGVYRALSTGKGQVYVSKPFLSPTDEDSGASPKCSILLSGRSAMRCLFVHLPTHPGLLYQQCQTLLLGTQRETSLSTRWREAFQASWPSLNLTGEAPPGTGSKHPFLLTDEPAPCHTHLHTCPVCPTGQLVPP